MIVEINAPSRRSLNANEKRVYQLAREGKTIDEIGKIMRLPVNYEGMAADEPLSVKGIMAQIRGKGWEINEEDDNMPRGNKTAQEVKEKIIKLHSEGKETGEIANAVKMPWTTVHGIIQRECKKEAPASVAADTSAEKVSPIETTVIIPEKSEKVKHIYSEDAINAVYNQMLVKADEIKRLECKLDNQFRLLDMVKHGIETIDSEIMFAQAELERLEQDYDNMCGGAR